MAMTSCPLWTATVTRYLPSVSVFCNDWMTCRSACRSVRPHSLCSASNKRPRSPLPVHRIEHPREGPRRGGDVRLGHVDGVQPQDGVHLERPSGELLANDLAVDLALGRDVDDEVTEHACDAGQPSVVSQTRYLAVLGLDGVGLRQVVGG